MSTIKTSQCRQSSSELKIFEYRFLIYTYKHISIFKFLTISIKSHFVFYQIACSRLRHISSIFISNSPPHCTSSRWPIFTV